MKNKIIAGLIVIMLSCFPASQVDAFRSDLKIGKGPPIKIKKGEKPVARGVVVLATLNSSRGLDYQNWGIITLVNDNSKRTKMDLLHCFVSLCLHSAKVEAGTYSLLHFANETKGTQVITTLTMPTQSLGKFSVEGGKVTDLGVIGVYMKREINPKPQLDRSVDEIDFYVDTTGARYGEYIKDWVAGHPGFSTEQILHWRQDSGFERLLKVKGLVGALFQDIFRTVRDDNGNIYFPTGLGDIYTLDTAGGFGKLETGADLYLHALYAEKDFFLAGGEAGKLYLYKPGHGDADVIGEFGKDDFVIDILKYDNQYYVLVLTGTSKGQLYRFSSFDSPRFEPMAKFSINLTPLTWFSDFRYVGAKNYVNYRLKQAEGGFFLRLGSKKLGYFDLKSGKLREMVSAESIEDFAIPGDGSLLIVGEETKTAIAEASALEDTGEVQLQGLPESARSQKSVKKGSTKLMSSKDWKTWDTLALLSGNIVSNVCFTDPGTAYLVLRKNVYNKKRNAYEYPKSELLKTVDGGRAWHSVGQIGTMPDSQIMPDNNFELVCDQSRLVLVDKVMPRLQVSNDGGQTWSLSSIYDVIVKSRDKKSGK